MGLGFHCWIEKFKIFWLSIGSIIMKSWIFLGTYEDTSRQKCVFSVLPLSIAYKQSHKQVAVNTSNAQILISKYLDFIVYKKNTKQVLLKQKLNSRAGTENIFLCLLESKKQSKNYTYIGYIGGSVKGERSHSQINQLNIKISYRN